MSRERIDVKQAAQILGISTDAVHKRVKRGSLDSDKDPNGRVFVYLDESLDDGYTRPDNVYTAPDAVRDELVEELRDRIRYLEEESRRKDSIILTMAQRIPELEPASEPREAPESAARASDTTEPRSATKEPQETTSRPQQERSWWRRWFGA